MGETTTVNNDTATEAPIGDPVQFTGIEAEGPAPDSPEQAEPDKVDPSDYGEVREFDNHGASFVYAELSPEKKAEVDEEIAKLDTILGRYRADNGVPVESKCTDDLTLSEKVEVLWKAVFGG